MGHAALGSLLRYLRRLHDRTAEASDEELLRRHISGEETAFDALLRRHAPMVWNVCRRLLDNEHDAEDAFQAVFLVLLRKAESLRVPQSLAAFLHGVASRIAHKANVTAQRRRCHEKRAETRRPSDPFAAVEQRELRALLDEELLRLPEKYRAPLVLCYLEGLSYPEAARQLGWRDGTVCGRLARAREMLRQRLSRRGVTLTVAALGALAEPAAAPAATIAAAAKMAVLCVLGQTAGSGAVSASVATLAQGALQAMNAATLKAMAALVVVLGLFAAGAGWTAHWVLSEKPTEPEPRAQASTTESASPARKDYYGDPLPPGAVARMGSLQLRHLRAHIAFAAAGKTLISAGPDRRVCTWDVATGRLIRDKRVRPLMPHGFLYYSDAALSDDGRFLAVHDGQTVYVHDAATGNECGQIPDTQYLGVQFQFSPHGKTLALLPVRPRDILRLWDVVAGKARAILKHPSVVRNCAFSADSKLLVSLTGDGLIRLWDACAGRELRTVRAEARGLAFSPDGKLLATSDNSGAVALWETATLSKRAMLKPSPSINGRFIPPEPLGLTFSPDGSLLAVAGYEALVLWDVAERKERRRLPDREARCLAFAPDGKTLATASEIEIRLWDVASGRQLHQRIGHAGEVSSVSVSPDGKILASAEWNDSLRLWDAATGKPLGSSPTGRLRGINSVFSPDGKWLIGADEGAVQFWDTATGKKGRRFVIEDLRGAKGKHTIEEMVLSSDGRRLTALSVHDNRFQLSVWDVQTGQSILRRPYRGLTITCASLLTPNGEATIVQHLEPGADPIQARSGGSAGALTLEETATGLPLLTIPRKLGYPLTFSTDGKVLAAGIHRVLGMERGHHVKSVSVIEMATGQEVLRLDGPITPLAFSPDGRVLATIDAVGDGGLRIWDVATGQRLFRRAWPDDAVRHPGWSPTRCLAFFPGGRLLATGMEDGTVLVWKLAPDTWPNTGIAQHLDAKHLDAAWSDLSGDSQKAHRAIYSLAAVPKQALPFLAERVRPVAAVDAKRVDKLLADLDSQQFAVREAAAKELADMGTQIQPKLRLLLDSKPSLELRNRLQEVQEKLRGVPPAATLRRLRTIRVLEMIGTAEARKLLGKLADGPEGARATSESKAALLRLAFRSSPTR